MILILCGGGCFAVKKCSNSSSSNQPTTAQNGRSAGIDQNNNQFTADHNNGVDESAIELTTGDENVQKV